MVLEKKNYYSEVSALSQPAVQRWRVAKMSVESVMPQSINSMMIEQQLVIDRLMELRTKMQHKRRSRVQDSLMNNTVVSFASFELIIGWIFQPI